MATCRMLPAEFVTNEISPNTRFVPQLMKTDTPSPASTSTGSAHDSVVSTRTMRMKATAKTVMRPISRSVLVVASADETADPVTAPSSPATERSARTASTSREGSIVTLNRAFPSL